QLLARNGYVAVTISYRLAPKHRFPAQIEDAKCAVRFLRARAKDLKVDPERIGAVGHSAGGHLSLLLGLMDARESLEGTSGHAGFSSKVQVVVNYFGPTDLRVWKPTEAGEKIFRTASKGAKGSEDLLRDVVGTNDRASKEVARFSPITYVTAKGAPVLT